MQRRRFFSGCYAVARGGAAAAVLLGAALSVLLLTARSGLGVQASRTVARHPVYSVETQERKVALGVNCAWGNEDIPALLESLRASGVTATFFVVGDWCDRFPASVRQLSGAGHEIGSHSDSHADMTRLGRDGILREIRESCRKLEEVTGKPVTLFRPPSGAYNNLAVELIEAEGLTPVQWDCERLHMKAVK